MRWIHVFLSEKVSWNETVAQRQIDRLRPNVTCNLVLILALMPVWTPSNCKCFLCRSQNWALHGLAFTYAEAYELISAWVPRRQNLYFCILCYSKSFKPCVFWVLISLKYLNLASSPYDNCLSFLIPCIVQFSLYLKSLTASCHNSFNEAKSHFSNNMAPLFHKTKATWRNFWPLQGLILTSLSVFWFIFVFVILDLQWCESTNNSLSFRKRFLRP